MADQQHSGRIIWITGLSGAGKSTLAGLVLAEFREKGIASVVLDGDQLRHGLREILPSDGDEYSKSYRERLGRTYFDLALLLADQGFVVIVATISLFHSVQKRNRALAKNYFEVYLETDDRVNSSRGDKLRETRVTKPDTVVGIGIPPEFPVSPDVHIVLNANCSKGEVLSIAMGPIWAWFLSAPSEESGKLSE